MLLEEVTECVKIEDSGTIDKILVQADTDKPVLLRGGGILRGNQTQSRGLQFSVVVSPHNTQEVPVLCVHSSHRIRRRSSFKQQGYAPMPVAKALQSGKQHYTWSTIRSWVQDRSKRNTGSCMRASLRLNDRVCSPLPPSQCLYTFSRLACESDDLVKALEAVKHFKTGVEESLRQIPADHERQVGLAIFDRKGLVGFEVFDHPDSYHSLSKSIIRQYRDLLWREDSDNEDLDVEKMFAEVKTFLEKSKQSNEKTVYETNRASTVLVQGDIVGEYTLMSNEVIHLLLTRKESNLDYSKVAQNTEMEI